MLTKLQNILCLGSIALLSACATTSTPYTGPDPEKIIEVSSDSAGIYQGSRQWIAENFKSANDVIQYQDESTATVIGRGRSKKLCRLPSFEFVAISTTSAAQCLAVFDVEFVLKVEAKEQRMRVTIPTISVISPRSQYSSGGTSPASKEVVEAIGPELLAFGDEIKAYIESGTSSNDW